MQAKSTNILGIFRTLLMGIAVDKNPHPIGCGFLSNYVRVGKILQLGLYAKTSPQCENKKISLGKVLFLFNLPKN